jgi:multiple sugar transport system ATP-binding protein
MGEPITVRVGGDVNLYHGDRVFLTPDPAQIHKFDDRGQRIA